MLAWQSDIVFVDTSFVMAYLHEGDRRHNDAMDALDQLEDGSRFLITESILVEIGDKFCDKKREAAVDFIKAAKNNPEYQVIPVTTLLLDEAIEFFSKRSDKEWGLTDCISFVVMKNHKVMNALTTDRHFVQAGFHSLIPIQI